MYLSSTKKLPANVIIRLLLSLLCWPKVILISGGQCILNKLLSNCEKRSSITFKVPITLTVFSNRTLGRADKKVQQGSCDSGQTCRTGATSTRFRPRALSGQKTTGKSAACPRTEQRILNDVKHLQFKHHRECIRDLDLLTLVKVVR